MAGHKRIHEFSLDFWIGVLGNFLVQGSDGGGFFAYFFGIYIESGYRNPSTLTPSNWVDVATYIDWVTSVLESG